MSKYFQALSRISQQAKPPQPAAPERPREKSEPKTKTAEEPQQQEALLHISPFADMPWAKQQRAYSELLDSMRSIPGGSGVPCTILAGVSRHISTTRVMQGLRDQSREQGVRLLSLEVAMEGSRRYLREISSGGVEERVEGHPTFFPDLRDREQLAQDQRPATSQIEEWLQKVNENFDLLVIQAPPLTESVEAALLARETDGLILVVENLVDSHVDLEAAVDKAQDADCTLLGVVLFGAKEWLPKWLRRLFKGRGPAISKNP